MCRDCDILLIHQVNKENKDRGKHANKGNIGHNYINVSLIFFFFRFYLFI